MSLLIMYTTWYRISTEQTQQYVGCHQPSHFYQFSIHKAAAAAANLQTLVPTPQQHTTPPTGANASQPLLRHTELLRSTLTQTI